jgi:hypothetical protein
LSGTNSCFSGVNIPCASSELSHASIFDRCLVPRPSGSVFSHSFLSTVTMCHRLAMSEGPIRRTREGGSEWEPIKILLEGDENSNKTNAASNTLLRLTTKVGQAHVATGVPLDLGTNTQPSDPRNAAEKPNLESTDPHRSDR